jgi:hypothetical protein
MSPSHRTYGIDNMLLLKKSAPQVLLKLSAPQIPLKQPQTE